MSWIKTDKGLTIADTVEILGEFQALFLRLFPNINLDASTPQGQIITALTQIIEEMCSDISVMGSIWLDGGSDVWLNARNETLYNLTRKPRINNSVTVLIGGVPQTLITPTFQIDIKGHIFSPLQNYFIPKTGQIYIEMYSDEVGNWQVTPDDTATILTPTKGVERVISHMLSIIGQEKETDTQFRRRAQESLFYNAISVFGATLARVAALENVIKVGGYENITSNTISYKNVDMPPHSISLIVKGGDIQDIGKTILERKNPGCGLGGNISISIVEPISNQEYEILFYRPQEKLIFITITISTNIDVDQTYPTIIKNILIEYINDLSFGSIIYTYELATVLNIPNLEIIDIKIGKDLNNMSNILNLDFLDDPKLRSENIVIQTSSTK